MGGVQPRARDSILSRDSPTASILPLDEPSGKRSRKGLKSFLCCTEKLGGKNKVDRMDNTAEMWHAIKLETIKEAVDPQESSVFTRK